jgi:hypothetical protein
LTTLKITIFWVYIYHVFNFPPTIYSYHSKSGLTFGAIRHLVPNKMFFSSSFLRKTFFFIFFCYVLTFLLSMSLAIFCQVFFGMHQLFYCSHFLQFHCECVPYNRNNNLHYKFSMKREQWTLEKSWCLLWQGGVNTIKGAKVKVISMDYIWHMAFLCWLIFLIFAFFICNLQLRFEYNIFYYILVLVAFIYNASMF